MKDYVITDNGKRRVSANWGETLFLLDLDSREDRREDIVVLTHDEAKEVAAFIMAQVKE